MKSNIVISISASVEKAARYIGKVCYYFAGRYFAYYYAGLNPILSD